MNDKDKEEFEKWFLEYPSWRVTMSRHEACEKAWSAACEYKQKEIYDLTGQLKSCIFVYEEKVSRLIAENKKLREALEEIRNIDWGTDHCDKKNMIADKILREA